VQSESPRLVAIHQSFLQPLLILGVERELFIATAVASGMLVFSLGNLILAVLGSLLWLLTLPFLQRLAQADPVMSRVYVRHARYASYYPARAHCAAPTRARTGWSQVSC
jgi:type IV secretory pathway TrbD component